MAIGGLFEAGEPCPELGELTLLLRGAVRAMSSAFSSPLMYVRPQALLF